MVSIIFESHGTTFDNENKVSSGHNDAELSPVGIQNAKDLGERRKDESFDTIFCSDLQRSYRTAKIAFGEKFPIIKDKRLRECDYGDLTQHPSSEVEPEKIKHAVEPFPNGESYERAAKRIKEFLDNLSHKYHDREVMVLIIGHRATQYGLEYWINGKSLEELLITPFVWQPGWEYQLNEI